MYRPRVHIDGRCLAPRCVGSSHPRAEVVLAGGCSPFKAVRELGLERRETVRSLIRRALENRGASALVRETSGSGRITGVRCHANGTARCGS